ncbi:MAG: hypothetical protein C7K11_03370 [Candidatus Amulumruptor caecigallinarius]|uniref:Uncharacterized protein n=1 Tax=Candidatus Amulumruptor caecigallinarius TaxID=2109911 RepID=A0A4Q0U9S0_9BACT|nr:MAG: hypothetical protein C7K11_03370 [Candidatus Amulumruptor caecigallinarius]HJE39809.1 hypothetical protein [Candidatus Amulumruptor caecigallinarius]
MRPRLILVTSCIIATLCGGAAYPQSKKGNTTKTAKSQAASTTSISAIDGIKKELSLYNLDKAEELIDKLETANRRNKKKNPLPDDFEAVKDNLVKIREMLDRVESIEIIDSTTVAKKDFYKYIPLSPSAGRYLAPSILPEVFPRQDATTVYATEDYSIIMWGARNPEGLMTIYQSDRLSDGTYATPVEIKGELGNTDIDYPFLSSDGITLYFASKSTDGLGGYDIYMTRQEDGKFLLPQNIGMPYNSTSDDYMYIIDDAKKVGWWLTERNAAPGMVTIYTFIPQELRKNYPPDTSDLASIARVKSYKDTWRPGKDYTQIIDAARQQLSDNRVKEPQFELYIPGKGIYHSLADFRSVQAQELMQDYIEMTNLYNSKKNHLSQLRLSYSSGDSDATEAILKGEKEFQTLQKDLKTLRNEIVRTEQSAK